MDIDWKSVGIGIVIGFVADEILGAVVMKRAGIFGNNAYGRQKELFGKSPKAEYKKAWHSQPGLLAKAAQDNLGKRLMDFPNSDSAIDKMYDMGIQAPGM